MPRNGGNMWRSPIQQLHMKQVALVSAESLSRGPWLTAGDLWMMSSFRQGNYRWLDQQQSKRKFKLVMHLPSPKMFFLEQVASLPNQSMRQVLWLLLLPKAFRVWTGSSCSPFCIQPFGSFSLAPCLRSRRRRRTPSIFLSKRLIHFSEHWFFNPQVG